MVTSGGSLFFGCGEKYIVAVRGRKRCFVFSLCVVSEERRGKVVVVDASWVVMVVRRTLPSGFTFRGMCLMLWGGCVLCEY